VVIDLIAARLATGRDLVFEASDVKIAGFSGGRPLIGYVENGIHVEVECDFIAGCDGFHGICRPSLPVPEIKSYDRIYPLAWLGVLAETPPASPELIYVHHERGFALLSMRSPSISRLYLQCPPDEDADRWSDTAFWDEVERWLEGRNVPRLVRGPILQKGVTGMRSFVADPMRHGRLFLAGDAAHIVPPTGAKGMNLAIGDVRLLSRAFAAHYKSGRDDLLDGYSATAMRRIWQAQRFSWWMTSLLHKFDNETPFNHYRQLAEMNYAVSSRAAATALAENYVGLPFDF
jgi:p-hydroxybenzoate 3-monooxygenase